jgi:hypothetical protein
MEDSSDVSCWMRFSRKPFEPERELKTPCSVPVISAAVAISDAAVPGKRGQPRRRHVCLAVRQ